MSVVAPTPAGRPLRGILLMVCAFGCITANDAVIKWVLNELPVPQAIFIRGIFSLVFITTLTAFFAGVGRLRWGRPGAQILCASLFTCALFCYITSLLFLPLAVAVVIMSCAPLFVTVMAPFVLGERVGWWRRIAVLMGFAGTLIVVQPGGEGFSWAVLLPVVGALLNAARELVIRRVIGGESTASLVLTAMAFVTIAAACASPFVWVPPVPVHFGLLALSGALLAGGLIMSFEAIRAADVSIVSPFQYSSVVWASLFGFVLWSELPSWTTIAGAALVICGGIIIVQRERLQRRSGQ